MTKKRSNNSIMQRWAELDDVLHERLPHLSAWYSEESEFAELRIKMQLDGTVLAIAKGFDSDGGPIVCFGSGYGVVAALIGIDRTIQGGHWRVDEPWDPKGK